MPTDAEAIWLSYWTDFYREFSPSLYEDRPRFLMTLNPPEPCAQPQIEIHNGSQACFIRAGIDVDRAGPTSSSSHPITASTRQICSQTCML